MRSALADSPEAHAPSGVFQDWTINAGNPKGRLILLAFRTASRFASRSGVGWFIPRTIVGVSYRFFVEWVLGVEIPWRLRLGPYATVYHGQSLVINDHTTIGRNVILRHNVTIGHKKSGGECPCIGDYVEIGAGAIILGGISIGDHAVIAAGAVVTKSVPAGTSVAGNPAAPMRTSVTSQQAQEDDGSRRAQAND